MPSRLIYACFQETCNLAEMIRCIHIGLLCVQQHPEDRPCMPSVILMLGSEIGLPQPKQPGYLADRKSIGPDSSSCMPDHLQLVHLRSQSWRLDRESISNMRYLHYLKLKEHYRYNFNHLEYQIYSNRGSGK